MFVTTPVRESLISTVTPAIAAPVGSDTTPVMTPRSACADRLAVQHIAITRHANPILMNFIP
jgi:hypothetical protein